MTQRTIMKILGEYQNKETDQERLTKAIDYQFQTDFMGKFICISPHENERYFFAAGIPYSRENGHSRSMGHKDMQEYFSSIESKIKKDHVSAAGIVAISLDTDCVLFFGKSEHFQVGFTRDDVLLTAYHIKEQTKRKVKTAIIASRSDPLLYGLVGNDIRPDGALGFTYDVLANYREDYGLGFLDALRGHMVLERMVIDLA